MSKHKYTKAALAENLPHLTDFLPKRNWALLVCALGGFTVVCLFGLGNLLHLERQRPQTEVLEILKTNSVASWFASTMLITTAMLSVLIFCLRRQRIDDYKARYRLWIPIAALSMFFSVDSTTAIGMESCRAVIEGLSPFTVLAPNIVEWSVFSVGVFFALKLFFEVRISRGSAVWLVLATCSYAVFFIAPEISAIVHPFENVLAGSSRLLGHLALNMAFLTFARFVFSDAQNSIEKANPKTKWARQPTKSSSPMPSESNKNEKRQANQVMPAKLVEKSRETVSTKSADLPLSRRIKRAETANEPAKASTSNQNRKNMQVNLDEPDVLELSNRMSKSERKRMRKEKRQRSRAA